MELTPEQKEKTLALISEKIGGRPCPMCGKHHDNILIEHEIQLLSFFRKGYGISNHLAPQAVLPTLAVTCSNCGYVALFNLIQMGVVDVSPQQ